MPGAGALRDKVTFQQRGEDANGDRLGGWEEGFTVPAELVWLRGSEGAVEARLQGRQPVVIRIRDESRTRGITSAWRAVNARNEAQEFAVKSAAPDRERGFWAVMAEWEPSNG